MLQRLSIFGAGYVGSVMAACLSEVGHEIVAVDSNPLKTELLNSGRSPIVEPGVAVRLARATSRGLLTATVNAAEAISSTNISFICVGTPSLSSGKLDVSGIARVCEQIGQALRHKRTLHTIVLRSTVLPGTAEKLVIPALEKSSGKSASTAFVVCSNPEFLREGTAVSDFMAPALTVLGAKDPKHLDILNTVYSCVSGPIFRTSLASAEMVKYACNAFHALKVTFANEIGTIAQALNVDVADVTKIFCADTKLNISPAYLRPGFAMGGSCLPKDLRAILHRARELDLEVPLLSSILQSNQSHIDRAIESILLTGKRKIGILGLSFKSGTDDLRESPYVFTVKRLIGEGCDVQIWDEDVSLGLLVGSNRQFITEKLPHIALLLRDSVEEVIQFADVLLIATPSLHLEDLPILAGQLVFDLTRLSKPQVKAQPAYAHD
jgi:GDP-mannose 6-dehydrogenase